MTCWFKAIFGALSLLLGWAVLTYRLRSVARRYDIRLDERVLERTRIARELHDSLLQGFQGVMFRLQAVRDLLPDRMTEALRALDDALQSGDQAINEGRIAVQNLRVSAAAGPDLENALRTLGHEFPALSGPGTVLYHVLVQGRSRPLAPLVRDEIYQIAREALRNAVQHARARMIEVELEYGAAKFRLRLRDDGCGIDSSVLTRATRGGHWGVQGMRERAEDMGGSLAIWSEHAVGTEVELTIPAGRAYGCATGGRRRWGNPFW